MRVSFNILVHDSSARKILASSYFRNIRVIRPAYADINITAHDSHKPLEPKLLIGSPRCAYERAIGTRDTFIRDQKYR